jgi:hypothetical protein
MGYSILFIASVVKRGALYSAVLLFSNAVGLALDSLIVGRNMIHYYTLFTLAEAALLFLVGGAMDVRGSLSFSRVRDHVTKSEKAWSADAHRKAQSKAAPFIVGGLILLALSFALAYPLN